MELSTKEQIRTELAKYVKHIGSGKKAEKPLGVSHAYISQILNNKADKVSDATWRKIAAGVGLRLDDVWNHVDTRPTIELTALFDNARLGVNCRAILCHPGSGKTHTLNRYAATHQNVIVVKCVEVMTVRSFYGDILKSLGHEPSSYNLHDIFLQVVDVVSRLESPVMIIDEIERVHSKFLTAIVSQIVDMFNRLEDICPFVVLGTSVLKKISDGCIVRQTANWNTFFDRFNIKWVLLTAPNEQDLLDVIKANGITGLNQAYAIINDSITTDGNYTMRRVKSSVKAQKKKATLLEAEDQEEAA
ncbi:ATP-binding protein [Mucilaginibacter sp.]|uniref:ATP-binding protein n=1 Tax=Mucilaginibacter sp. TaxID=1882438 RepID=UPI0025D596D5|nr:ATP-binding protein [Mucilaginibacter sp.]